MTINVMEGRAILFDMDGTLVDSTPVVERVWARFAARHGLDVTEILTSSHGRQMKDTVLRWGPTGVDVAAESLDLSTFELAQTEGIRALAGATTLVNALPRHRLALVTSAPLPLAEARMTLSGLNLPSVIVTAEDVANGKPNPDCYLLAASLLGVDPADAIVFEDAEAGIIAALAAGMRTVVVGNVEAEVARGLPRIRDYRDVSFELRTRRDGVDVIVLTL
jgi:sugar-phosphatase